MMSHLTVSVPWPEGAESTGFLAAKVACCGKCSTYMRGEGANGAASNSNGPGYMKTLPESGFCNRRRGLVDH